LPGWVILPSGCLALPGRLNGLPGQKQTRNAAEAGLNSLRASARTFLAFLLLDLPAVLLGEGLARVVRRDVVLLPAAAVFMLFAWKIWKDSDEEESELDDAAWRRAFITSLTLI
jgi:hypothetical protein